ncbi:MAG: CRISPR-associated endonuclease Cas1 [Actinobacteria bacterium]|nr:CRISPR-associated endonuclease Cas1 [Actinomycetota bacterium]
MESADYIPLRYLNEFIYCPRLGYLEFAWGEFEENEYTIDGEIKHKRIDEIQGRDGDAPAERMTSVFLSSEKLGLIGRIDLLECEGGEFIPVEYKRGKIPKGRPQGYDPERVQLCAQGLLLSDNDYPSTRGYIYYSDSHKRIEVLFDDELKGKTLSLIEEFRKTLAGDEPPPPLDQSPKCARCSLNRVCIPDETSALAQVRGDEEDAKKAPSKVRRLLPAVDDNRPLYVANPGTRVGKEGERVVLKCGGEELGTVRFNEVSQVCLYGNVQLSSQATREFMLRGIPVVYFSGGGWFYGIAHSNYSKNAFLRIRQVSMYLDDHERLRVSRQLIRGKIRNCRTLVRRNLRTAESKSIAEELGRLANRALRSETLQELLGIEGQAAHLYFKTFAGLIRGKREGSLEFEFTTRKRRPATDPVNAMLSYGYSLLLKDCFITLLSVGFDPYIGFYHQPKYGKPALALDLMEEFRPIVVDSVVLTSINNGEVRESDFVSRMGRVIMKERARTGLIEAYERRMNSTVKHPLFGYTVSYRRVLEVQARLLARLVCGEIDLYVPFCTR